jgi:hypothetical protein
VIRPTSEREQHPSTNNAVVDNLYGNLRHCYDTSVDHNTSIGHVPNNTNVLEFELGSTHILPSFPATAASTKQKVLDRRRGAWTALLPRPHNRPHLSTPSE